MTEPTETRAIAKLEGPHQPSEPRESIASAEFSTPAPGGSGKGIAFAALAVTAVMGVAGLIGWQQLHRQQTALEQRLHTEEQAVSGLQSATQSDTQTLQQQLATFRESLTVMQQHDTRVDERLTEIGKRLEERRGSEWLVAEARHLISIASYQAQLNHDAKTALIALETADQRLRETDDPSLLRVRQALSNDMATLRAIPTVDTAGIALLLNQLEQQVAGLPLASGDDEAVTPSPAPATSEESSGVARFFSKVWSDIKGLVTIRHNSGPAGTPLATPAQRTYLQQNLRLKLEVARLALLQHDTQTFRDTLATIRQWLESYYDTKAATTAAMLTSLVPFATLELQPDLPDVGHALQALDSWQEQRRGRTKVEGAATGGATPS